MRRQAAKKGRGVFASVQESMARVPPDAEYVDRGGICGSGEVLEDLLKKLRLDEQVNNRRIREVWPSLVGEPLASRCHPDSLRRGVLVVRVTDSATSHHISALKAEILSRLNEIVGEIVREIKTGF